MPQSFYPFVTRLDGIVASEALCCEQLIPVGYAIGQIVFQIEGIVAESALTMGANETVWVPCLAQSFEAILILDSNVAFGANGR